MEMGKAVKPVITVLVDTCLRAALGSNPCVKFARGLPKNAARKRLFGDP